MDVRDCIQHIEQHADEAKRCVQQSQVAEPLRQAVEQFHQAASRAKHQMGSSPDEQGQKQLVTQMEEAADRALEACKSSGTTVEPKLQQAIQSAHDEARKLKQQLEGSPA